MKECRLCGIEQEMTEFHKNPVNKDGRDSRCKTCCKAVRRKKYENTWVNKEAFLRRAYSSMKQRCTNPKANIKGLYVRGHYGKELLDRDEFIKWSLNESDFPRIYDEWITSGRDRCLSPSIDRIFPDKGYVLINMQWITLSENSRRNCNYMHHGII